MNLASETFATSRSTPENSHAGVSFGAAIRPVAISFSETLR